MPSEQSSSMAPTLEDELNAAWAEVNKARGDRDRYRSALERIESHGAGYAVGIARAALEGDQ